MKPLIIDRLGVSLKVSLGELVISEVAPNREIARFQLGSLPFDSLVLSPWYGLVSIEALRALADSNVQFFLTSTRGVECSLLPRQPSNAALRLEQIRAYDNKEKRLTIANAFVEAKTRSQ